MQTEKKQLGQVLDLNKCIGCQTCTVSCKQLWTDEPGMEAMWWNIVNTLPGQGHPKNWEKMGGGWKDGKPQFGKLPSDEDWGVAWDFNFDELFYGGNAQDVFLKPRGETPQWGPNWDEDQGGGKFPNGYYFYLPRLCNHCSNPACLPVCPTKSIFKRAEDGAVLINEETCRGNRLCQMTCPYKRIYFNPQRKISQKCIGCFPRTESGTAPACVRQCPGRVRHFGDVNDPNGNIFKLRHHWKVALPLHSEFGTEPNMFYIPPILPAPLKSDGTIDAEKERLPRKVLRDLFGDEVDSALDTLKGEKAKRQNGQKSELMDILISRKWRDLFPEYAKPPVESKSFLK